MIPIKAEPEARGYYVSNIMKVFWSASPDQVRAGSQWYQEAHRTASLLADGDVRMGAGLLAALSPQTSWWLNVELACDAYQAGRASRHVSDARSKANRILAGIDPADVLPMDRKTGHFYRSILNPSDREAVCIDRHAHDVAVGVRYGDWSRGLSTQSRYDLIAGCYRQAAAMFGTLPSTVQAITWVTWRDSLVNTGSAS